MTSDEDQPDLYLILGLPTDASRAEIVRAYRQRARAVHPDARPGDPDASARFRALTDAYDVLSDPARRDAYDHRRGPAEPAPRAPAWRPSPAWPRPGPGMPLWAGPVHIRHDEPQDASGGSTLLGYLINRYFVGEDWVL